MYKLAFRSQAFVAAGILVALSTPFVVKLRGPFYFLVGLEPEPTTATWNDVGFTLLVTLPSLFVVVLWLVIRRKGKLLAPTDLALYVGYTTAAWTMLPYLWSIDFVERLLGSWELARLFLVFSAMFFVHGAIAGFTYFAFGAERVQKA